MIFSLLRLSVKLYRNSEHIWTQLSVHLLFYFILKEFIFNFQGVSLEHNIKLCRRYVYLQNIFSISVCFYFFLRLSVKPNYIGPRNIFEMNHLFIYFFFYFFSILKEFIFNSQEVSLEHNIKLFRRLPISAKYLFHYGMFLFLSLTVSKTELYRHPGHLWKQSTVSLLCYSISQEFVGVIGNYSF